MNYPHMLFAVCNVGSEQVGNALASAVGYGAVLPAFGGEFGIKLQQTGGDGTHTAWAAYGFARQSTADIVAEYNGSAPYVKLNARGITDEQVNDAKSVLQAYTYPRATHEAALAEVLAGLGFTVRTE